MDVSLETRIDNCKEHGDFESKAIKLYGKIIHWSKCNTCGEIERSKREAEEAKREAEAKQRRLEARLNQSGMPLRFRDKTFSSYVADTDPKEKAKSIAMEFAANFARHSDVGTFLVFSGMPGTGKSHLACAIAKDVMKTQTSFYTSAIDAVRMIRDTWRRGADKTETQVLDMFSCVDLLILDEVGVQYGTEAEQVNLFDIIDKRYRDLMPTILLTNLGTKGMKEFLGDRSYDRLREGGIWVTFDWESQRRSVRSD